jgi:cellobiose phosphorylase
MLANMGRCFGYAFGHKENGAVFSHMTVMYAYALYERGYAREAYRALDHLYHQSTNFADSRMFPGIPEYFSARGRGMYPYLTGSASWYLLTMLTQAFGMRGASGDLVLAPQLVREQFGADGTASVQTWFAGRQLRVSYQNPSRLDDGDYAIKAVCIDGKQIEATAIAGGVCISRSAIVALDAGRLHEIAVQLDGDIPGIF